MNSERNLLLHILDEAYTAKGWQGPTLRGALRGVNAGQALWRPDAGPHNIWELVLHCAWWKHVVWRRLTGDRAAFPRSGKNWFETPDPTDRAWKADLALLDDVHQRLRAAVEETPLSTLRAKARQVYGAAAHDAYHTGQIQMLKRMHSR